MNKPALLPAALAVFSLHGATPPAVNVKNFGAMGNGVADDAPAIQKAIAALPVSGGVVIVPPGTFLLGTSAGGVEHFPDGQPIASAIVVNKNNVRIEGRPSSLLQLMAGRKMRVISVTGTNVTIDGLIVDGNKSRRNGLVSWPDGDVVDALVYFDSMAHHGTVQNCEVRNGIEDGIGFWQCPDGTVRTCYDHDLGTPHAGGSGFSLSGGARARAIDNRSINNTVGIWSAFGSRDVTIEHNVIKNNAQEGIIIGGLTTFNGAGENRGFTIAGNFLEGNGAAGFAAVSICCSRQGLITSNTVVNNSYDGIQLSDDHTNTCRGWIIEKNICANTDGSHRQKHGIHIMDAATQIVVKQNTCENNGQGLPDQIMVTGAATINGNWQKSNELSFRPDSAK